MADEELLRQDFLDCMEYHKHNLVAHAAHARGFCDLDQDHNAISALCSYVAENNEMWQCVQTYFEATMTPTDLNIFYAWLLAANEQQSLFPHGH